MRPHPSPVRRPPGPRSRLGSPVRVRPQTHVSEPHSTPCRDDPRTPPPWDPSWIPRHRQSTDINRQPILGRVALTLGPVNVPSRSPGTPVGRGFRLRPRGEEKGVRLDGKNHLLRSRRKDRELANPHVRHPDTGCPRGPQTCRPSTLPFPPPRPIYHGGVTGTWLQPYTEQTPHTRRRGPGRVGSLPAGSVRRGPKVSGRRGRKPRTSTIKSRDQVQSLHPRDEVTLRGWSGSSPGRRRAWETGSGKGYHRGGPS